MFLMQHAIVVALRDLALFLRSPSADNHQQFDVDKEEWNRKNVTVDVKHYEDFEQLFVTVGKCFVILWIFSKWRIQSTS